MPARILDAETLTGTSATYWRALAAKLKDGVVIDPRRRADSELRNILPVGTTVVRPPRSGRSGRFEVWTVTPSSPASVQP